MSKLTDIRIVFLGATRFSRAILEHLLKHGISVQMVFSIPREFNISYSGTKVTNYNYSDLSGICREKGIPIRYVESGSVQTLKNYHEQIRSISPDIILAMGWFYMVPREIRDLAKLGVWGIHASLLPNYAGGAPLVWAIIEGREQTGVTLFRFDDGVDDGDLIAQKKIIIKPTDTIKEVYRRATSASKSILLKTLKALPKIQFKPQDKSNIRVYPQRKPEDGQIDFAWDAVRIYNFIRAQSSPYPGAFIRTNDGHKLIIEKARLEL